MPMSTLTSKYQATIPKVVREALALGAGDRIEFLIEPAGMIQLRKAPRLDAELRAIELNLTPEWDSPDDDTAFAEL